VAFNEDAVMLTRRHNDANVLALGAKYTDAGQAHRYATIFLETAFEGGRHQRRVDKIAAIGHLDSGVEEQVKNS
jgi:ribose 5-phosphate isomerase B